MKKKMLLLVLVSMLAISMVLTAACGGGNKQPNNTNGQATEEKSYTFKLAHITPPTHGWHQTAEKFNEELQARSGGRMKVEIYPSSQLGTEADMVQQLETGAVDFAFITNAYMSTRAGSFSGWFMPFLFSDIQEASKARTSDAAQGMLKELESQGLIGLGFSFAGNRHILMKQGSISSPNDLAGKKLRITGGPAVQDFWAGIGVSPTPMPLPEIYTSLQTGVIDGLDIDLDALVTLNLFEIAQDLTLTNHMAFPAVVLMSKAKSDALAEKDNQIIREAMAAAIEWGIKDAIEREEKNLATVKSKGLKVTVMTDYSAFDEIRSQISQKYSSQYPLIKSFIDQNQ